MTKPVTALATSSVSHDPARRSLRWISVAACVWAAVYAAYRSYYGFGGRAFLPGTIRPGSETTFQLINFIGAAVILVAAVVPIAILPLWSRPRLRRGLLILCWVVAVGCCMHALVDIVERVLSLAGAIEIHYPDPWASVDHRAADVQDLFFNEPWFLFEGLAFAALAWIVMGPGRGRRWWLIVACVALVGLVTLGLLVMTGVVGQVILF